MQHETEKNELQPLDPPFAPEIAAILENYPQQDGYLLSLFRTFANSARFLGKCVPNLLDRDSPLDLRMREIAILRVTGNRDCEYEWGVHVAVFAKAAGLTDEQVAATRSLDLSCFSDKEQRLVEAIDQLCAAATLDDAALGRFQEDWSREQQLEILALCGVYTLISSVANVARLPRESFAASFP